MRALKFRIWNNTIKYFIRDFNGGPAVFDLLGLSQYLQTNYIANIDHFRFLQCTGLRDISGVEIFEGDVVKYKTWSGRQDGAVEEHRTQVLFKDGGYYPRYIDDECEDRWYSFKVYDLEVIGNGMEHLRLDQNE
jgi:uncharacterized phage protein (TIGR01671 family)